MSRARGAPALVALPLAACLALALFPWYWILASSLRPETAMFDPSPSWLPVPLTLEHYARIFGEGGFLRNLRNSLVVAGVTTLLSLALGSLAAYALTRLRVPGAAGLLGILLAVGMLPEIGVLGPLFLLLKALSLLNTLPGLILPYLAFGLPLTVWILAGAFAEIPAELTEAAALDGATPLQTLLRVFLPLAAPGLAAAGLLTFIGCWNEFLFALALTQDDGARTVPVAIALFSGHHSIPWGQIMAAIVVVTVPVAAVVLALQRRIVEGLTAGGLKG